jgi:hypothetical protein
VQLGCPLTGSHVRARGVCDLRRSAAIFIVSIQNRPIYHHDGITRVNSWVSIGAHRVRRGTIRGRTGRVLRHDRGRGMGRRAWGWKAVGDRAGSAQESLQLHPRGSVKAEKKRRVYNCQNLFLSLFLSFPLRSFSCLGSPSLLCVRACPPNCVSPFHSSPHALLNESVLCFRCESNDEEVPVP